MVGRGQAAGFDHGRERAIDEPENDQGHQKGNQQGECLDLQAVAADRLEELGHPRINGKCRGYRHEQGQRPHHRPGQPHSQTPGSAQQHHGEDTYINNGQVHNDLLETCCSTSPASGSSHVNTCVP